MILIRHAQSMWNLHFERTRIDPVIPDPPLSPTGVRQAEEMAGRLAGGDVVRLISSPYRRALETTMIVARRLGLPVEIDALVRERCAYSCDQGTHPAELARHWPEFDFSHLDDVWWGGEEESPASLDARCTSFRQRIDGTANPHAVAIVTHWGFIRAMTGREVANATFVPLA